MNDLEQELRELLETKAREPVIAPAPTPRLLKRTRRRQVGTVLTAIAGTAALVLTSLIGLQSLIRTEPRPPSPADVPVLPDAPEGFRSVALPFASIAYPEDWYLLELSRDETNAPILQLTNFDPLFTRPCFTGDAEALPPGGVLLAVEGGSGPTGEDAPRWPVNLAFDPSPSACRPGGLEPAPREGDAVHRSAGWASADGTTPFTANALFGPEVSAADRDALIEAFASMRVVESEIPQTEGLLGTSNLILDSAVTPVGPVALYAYREPCEGSTTWIGIAGPSGSGLSGAVGCGQDVIPTGDESVTMHLDEWGGIVWGKVADVATRAELRTVEGATYPATLVPLPPSVRIEGINVVWGVIVGPTADRVTTLLYDGAGNLLNDHVVLGRTTIATGTDPEGGPWELYLEVTSDGTGLGFGFENGSGGSGCCLSPLRGDFRLDGTGSGGDEPSNITALASEMVTRVVFESIDGAPVEGELFSMPEDTIGVPQVALVLVPRDVPLEGVVLAYDADGNELGREAIGEVSEPPGPTTEIDVVWTRLRSARDGILRYAGRHDGSLAGLDAAAAERNWPVIRWNDSGQGKPVPGQVSIRGVAPAGGSELTGWSGWTVVLVSPTAGPDDSIESTYCIGVNVDESGGGNFRYGTQDAASYEECRGGWPELDV